MLLDDFLRYVKVETQSHEESETTPSSQNQFVLLNLLKDELCSLKVECHIDAYGRLYGYVPGNKKLACIGLCAHVDTASECSGENVKPQIIRNYAGQDVDLGHSGLHLSCKDFPKLKEAIGKTLITTDGSTLLGADDKAGVAIVMDVVRNVLKMKEDDHHPLAILFTPDEEIGRGPEHFNLQEYRAKYAYTIDGGDPHLISIENFNAKSADITIIGKSIHPGEGKGKLINAILLLNEFINLLPKDMIPFKTEERQGFNHITFIQGDGEKAEAHYIIRNHDEKLLAKQVQDFEKAKARIEKEYPDAKVELAIKDSYKNMLGVILNNPECRDKIVAVYKRLDIPFSYEATRGGTDGATFSYLGCPCPNLGTGSYNHHGRYEFAILEEMELMSKIVTEIFKK